MFELSNAYPNPFNPSTSFKLAIPQEGFVSLQVYNVLGQVVTTLYEGNLTAKTYTFTWNSSNVSSGMYFIKAQTAENVEIQKIILMK